MAEAQVGQRYEKVGAMRLVWEVIAIGADLGGIPHCHIVDVKDRTNIKLISEMTLTSRKFYRLFVEA